MNNVITLKYKEPEYNRREILRYMGQKTPDEISERLIDKCVLLTSGKLDLKVCYAIYPLKIEGNAVMFAGEKIISENLNKNLAGCKSVILFAATAGLNMDRLTFKYSSLDSAMHACLQATGAERVESLCDVFNNEIKEKYITSPRYSPGYGDVGLENQRIFFRLLDCYKNIGVSLGDDLMMKPTKSVTAFIGIKGEKE